MLPRFIVLHHFVASPFESIQSQIRRSLAIKNNQESYHYVVLTNGQHVQLNDINKPIGHCGVDDKSARINNYNSIGVCCWGNYEYGTMSESQYNGLRKLIISLLLQNREMKDEHHIVRHKDVCRTACPGRYYPYNELKGDIRMLRKPKQLIFDITNDKIVVDEVVKEGKMLNIWGTTVVAIRSLLEALNYSVSFNKGTQQVIAKDKGE